MSVDALAIEGEGGVADPAAQRKRMRRLFHDMRGPLNVVIGMTELLVNGEVDPSSPQHREFLNDVLAAGRRLLALVNDVSTSVEADPEGGLPK